MNMKNEIEKYLKQAILEVAKNENAVSLDEFKIAIDRPKDEQFGDYTTNIAMVLAKPLKKSPMEIAEVIKAEILRLASLAQDDILEKVEVVAPGYINFYLSKKYFQNLVAEINEKGEKYGALFAKKEKVMVEYSQPNTHKEFHIGHLRNVFTGSMLANLLEKAGYEVIRANYIGDTGSHIAKCLWGLEKFHANESIDDAEDKAQFLGKVYTEAVRAITDNPKFEDEFKQLQKKFDDGDERLVSLWEKTKQWSMDEFQEIYDETGAKFDVYFWESVEEQEGKGMLSELLKYDFIKESQGAIVADLEKYNLGVLVLRRKDGGVLYGLKDIPLAVKKFKEFDINKSVVVVDIRQSLYFKQLFKILELMGFDEDTKHVGYEFVTLKGSDTMSSRKGNIIPAKVLINEVIGKVQEKFPGTDVAKSIGIGALKFFMLKYSVQSKIEFNVEESVRLDGATGPYVQYAHARICSILTKAADLGVRIPSGELNSLEVLVHEKEVSLIKELEKFPELVEEIAESYEVHKLPHYAIRLADKFHSFYDACRVIDEENEELTKARLSLVQATKIVLAETLRLIGVDAPEKM